MDWIVSQIEICTLPPSHPLELGARAMYAYRTYICVRGAFWIGVAALA